MKNGMNRSSWRQIKLISYFANAFQNPKWSKELEGEFVMLLMGHG
jgi:hypothetical protein